MTELSCGPARRPTIPRIKQRRANRGSQRWLQLLVNQRPELFAREFLPRIGYAPGEPIQWLSPRESDSYAEYQDESFLEALGIKAGKPSLIDFWPRLGPVWDGLAVGPRGEPILVEAKAHIPEMYSPACSAREVSLARIRRTLTEVKKAVGSTSKHDWSGPFYQYTNRLAHLYFLRTLNRIPAHLVFLYFVNARDVRGPSSVAEWEGAIELVRAILGLRKTGIGRYVEHLFVDADALQTA